MKKWNVAAAIVGLLPILAVVGMFIFSSTMAGLERTWMHQNLRLTSTQEFALEVSRFWSAYWYVIAPLVVLVSVGLAVACIVAGRARREADRASGARP